MALRSQTGGLQRSKAFVDRPARARAAAGRAGFGRRGRGGGGQGGADSPCAARPGPAGRSRVVEVYEAEPAKLELVVIEKRAYEREHGSE